MRKGFRLRAGLLLAALGLGPAVWVCLLAQSSRFTILAHEFRFQPLLFVPAWVLFFFILASVSMRRGASAETPAEEKRSWLRPQNIFAFLPLLFFSLSPLLLAHYLTRNDLQTRLVLLVLFIILAVLVLTKILDRSPAKSQSLLTGLEAKFSLLPRRKRILVLFLAAFLVYNACVLILVSQGITFSGDEPHYLMSSHSLLLDHDLNVANNYARKDYFHFYDESKNPNLKLAPHGRPGRKGQDHIYPINLPGISVLMLPFYGLSFLAKGKLLTFLLKGSLSVWAALLGVQFYLLALQTWKRERLALRLWLLYAFTAPVLFYAIHLYPELPVALICILIYRKITSSEKLAARHYLLFGFLLALLPWFGLKYGVLSWSLAIIVAYYAVKVRREGAKVLIPLLAVPLLSQGLFLFYTYELYGTVSPFSIYRGVITPDRVQEVREGYLGVPFRQRVESFFEYFLDQRDGLLPYAPFYLFSFLGLVAAFRARRRDFWAFLVLTGPYLAAHALFTERGGFSPQARPLASISWVMMTLIGVFLVQNRRPMFATLFKAAAAASLAVAALLLTHPSFLYQPTSHEFTSRPGDLFVFLSNIRFFVPPLLPSFIKIPNEHYLPNYLWLAALAAFILTYVLVRPPKARAGDRIFPAALVYVCLIAGFGLWVLFPRPALYPAQTMFPSPQKALAFYQFPMGKGVIIKPPADLYLHQEKNYTILFNTKIRLEKLRLTFGSDKGEFDVQIRYFDIPIFEGRVSRETRELELATPACYPNRNLNLYGFEVRLRKLSDENMLTNPFLVRFIPAGY